MAATQRPNLKKQLSSSEFQCGCCYEVLVEPTTLTCGHSFCRLCLAQWYGTSRKKECPECRQHWQGHPKVNIILRKTIDQLFPDQVEKRFGLLQTSQARDAIRRFEESAYVQQKGVADRVQAVQAVQQERGKNLIKGVFIGGTAIIVISYVWGCMFNQSPSFFSRPVSRWTEDEVSVWLSSIGPWAQEHLHPAFKERHIDGMQLLVVSEEDIEELSALTSLQRKAFQLELHSLREHGMASPRTMEDYRDAHLSSAAFYLQGMLRFPRLTILYIVLFDYSDSFLPFIHVSEPVIENLEAINLYTYKFPPPSLKQWVSFVVKWLTFPYYPCVQLAWRAGDWYLWLTVSINCIALTVMDVLNFYKWGRQPQNLGQAEVMKGLVKSWTSAIMIWLCSRLLPSFLLRLYFNVALFFMPYVDAFRACQALQQDL